MEDRKKAIQEIINNFQIVKNRMHAKLMSEPNAITNSQWFVLDIIDRHADFGIKDVSLMLGISSSAATQLVNSLVDNGYVARSQDLKDRRGLNLALSKKGKKMCLIILFVLPQSFQTKRLSGTK